MPFARSATIVRIAQRNPNPAAPRPSAVASAPSTSASANSCPTIRPRDAPNALRTVISLSRVAARANINSATFAQISASSITNRLDDITSSDRPPVRLSIDFG
jgi:hypothetical protein